MEKRFGSSRTRRDVNELIEAVGGQGARVYRTSAFSVPSTVATAIPFDAVRFDTDGIYAAAYPTRLTCVTPGIYVITGHLGCSPSMTGRRGILIRLNGSYWIGSHTNPAPVGSPSLSVAAVWWLNAGDYVELLFLQDTGANLDVIVSYYNSPEFAMVRIGG